MLAIMAKRVGYWAGGCLGLPTPGLDLGEVFAFWVSLDAFVVLSGAVLTAYVGISGLLARMAKDRCLPQFMLRKVSCVCCCCFVDGDDGEDIVIGVVVVDGGCW